MEKILINGVAGLRALAGKEVGVSSWKTMELSRIRAFADATDDHQWIHVDEERAARESPFGKPIAHGYLSLSLVAGLFFELLELRGFALVINYGTNKVRFPSPLRVGDRFRLAMKLGEVKEVGEGWIEATFQATLEIEGQGKPACAAECIYRFKAA
ncbi:MAG: MaoC family dehydratase [Myxococcales bacterium]|nr:MaoC family dehydratase [Polyangiaceae bacterium]MDW8250390.1 MaoC family dehydratase [Myxococcales bacterium]